MNARELPTRLTLEQFNQQATDLVKIFQSGDLDAIGRFKEFYSDSHKFSAEKIREALSEQIQRDHPYVVDKPGTFSHSDAQLFIAHEFGFEDWSALANHVEALTDANSLTAIFEDAVDAIVTGDAAKLSSLLRMNPEIISQRSTRVHHATLLHYISANGVEDYRQKSSMNAVEIAKVLLDSGAEVDATADTYGGGTYQTTMNLLVSSCHPANAGVQTGLVETLVEYGAAINGLDDDGSPLITALAFHYKDAGETLATRGARVDNVLAAAGLGREDLVRSFVDDNGELRPEVPLTKVRWLGVEENSRGHLELALIWAAGFGHLNIVDFLATANVDLSAKDNQGMTALHWAAWYGHLDVIELLLNRGAPLEVENNYGGTVLSSTVYASVNSGLDVDYVPVIDRLLAGGARIERVGYPSGNRRVDEVLERHRAKQ
jgi:hypothetical protein